MPKNCVPLPRLIAEWSEQSGELCEVVLTNLCQQEELGRFPEDTFRDAGTGAIGSVGALSKLVAMTRTGGYRFARREAAETLDAVVASKEGVLEFCRSYDVRPPRSVIGTWAWKFWRKASSQAPTPYPFTPAEIAEEREKAERRRAEEEASYQIDFQRSARNALSSLETTLKDLETRTHLSEKQYWDFWEGVWSLGKSDCQNPIDNLLDADIATVLESELKELDSRFARVKATEVDHSSRPAEATAAAETEARRYLEDQVRAGNRLTKSEHLRKAEQLIGPQLSERAFIRAWDDVVPAGWRKQGRPKGSKVRKQAEKKVRM